MERLTETVHRILSEVIQPGDITIDATAGNGHDTVFLSQAVGPSGRVFAFDLQRAAIENTRQRLQTVGWENVVLLQSSHAEMAKHIPSDSHGKIAAIVFNLGYLPGSDKTYITQSKSTSKAIIQGLELLRKGGAMTILAYIGHPGGWEECQAVESLLQTLPAADFTVDRHVTEFPGAPRLFVVHRRDNPED